MRACPMQLSFVQLLSSLGLPEVVRLMVQELTLARKFSPMLYQIETGVPDDDELSMQRIMIVAAVDALGDELAEELLALKLDLL